MARFSVLLTTLPPAGGAGDASGATVKIDGREVLLRSVELFLNRDEIAQVQICFLPEHLEEGKRRYGGHLSFSGVKVLSGGPKWIDQVAAAADRIADDATHVLVHDAARPALPYPDLEALQAAAEKSPASMLVAPLRSGLIEVDDGDAGRAAHPARAFVLAVTPLAYDRATFLKMAQTRQEPHVSAYALVRGSPLNIRAGGGDAALVSAMLKMMPKPRIKGPSSPFEEAQW